MRKDACAEHRALAPQRETCWLDDRSASREIQMFKVGLNYRFGSLFGGGYGGAY